MEEFQYCATPTSSQFVHQSVLRSSQQPQQQAYYSNEPGQLSSLYGATQQYNSNDIKTSTPLRNCLSSNSNSRSSTLPYSYNSTSTSLTSGSLAAASSSVKQEFDLKNQARPAGTRNHPAASSALCAMDRLSPYGSYDDSRNGTNLAGLSLDQIFKSNPNDDSDRNDAGRGPTGQEAILLLNQNIECLKQAYANGSANSNHGSLGPSSSPTTSTISNMSNLDVNNQLSSPPTSTSPSSSTDTPSTYGTLTNTILNGALTPPPDNSANSLTNDSVVSSSVYNPYSLKGVQLQHSHHHQSQLASLKLPLNGGNGANLVNLVPSNANANNPANSLMSNAGTHLNSTSTSSSGQMLQQTNAVAAAAANMNMVNILTPSKPLNISELSNCSLMSSTSSSGSSNLDASNAGSNNGGTGKRARGSKSSTVDADQKDGKYFERRKRNNVAAKKSRDARKQREDEIAIRASFLEKENSILKAQLQTLKDEAQQLRILLAQKKSSTASLASTSSCSNCSNCSAMVAAAAAAAAAANGMQPTNGNGGLVGVGGPVGCHKQSQPGNGLGGMMSHGGYGAPNINNLAAQLNGYEHSDLDKQQVINANSAAAAANPSIYLQHQNQHRHSII